MNVGSTSKVFALNTFVVQPSKQIFRSKLDKRQKDNRFCNLYRSL